MPDANHIPQKRSNNGIVKTTGQSIIYIYSIHISLTAGASQSYQTETCQVIFSKSEQDWQNTWWYIPVYHLERIDGDRRNPPLPVGSLVHHGPVFTSWEWPHRHLRTHYCVPGHRFRQNPTEGSHVFWRQLKNKPQRFGGLVQTRQPLPNSGQNVWKMICVFFPPF